MEKTNQRKESKNFVFVNQDSGYLMIDIINAYLNRGNSCTLITGRLVERNIKIHPLVQIDRIITYNRSRFYKRIFTWFYCFLQIWNKITLKYKSAELFIVSNPPLATLIPLFCSNKFTLLLFDIYIEKPSEILPLKKYSPISILWIYLHKRVFKKAKKIITITEGMKEKIGEYADKTKIQVIPIWTDNNFLKPIPSEENPFIISNQLTDKFKVLYSGTIGKSSNLELMLDVALRINEKQIIFIFIGEGAGKLHLQKKAHALNVNNVLFFPWQDPNILPFSLACADIAIVTLSAQVSNMAIPSKVFNYMSVGAPIISVAQKDSDLARLVIEHDLGMNFETNQEEKIKQFILDLYYNKSKHNYYSSNSLKASTFFTKDNVYKIFN